MGPETEYALIPLTKGQWATVDWSDDGLVSKHKWQAYLDKSTGTFYARTSIPTAGEACRQRTLGIHRLIMGDPPGEVIDHRDRETLNNRRRNLRGCKTIQNSWNRLHRTTAPFPGIQRLPSGKWRARHRVNGAINGHLGVFDTAEVAATAVRNARIEKCGEFARFDNGSR